MGHPVAVVDFETYYGEEYTLSKMTTEAYVRDQRFETILCGFKIGKEPGYWVDGPDVAEHLEELQLEGHAVIAHHAHFDGLILSHHYGITPALWIDTLSMARARHGVRAGNSLAKLCERNGIGKKGTEVTQAFGKRRRDFTERELRAYGAYCVNDCEKEYQLAKIYSPYFCRAEIELIDAMIRTFTEPVLQLNRKVLKEYLIELAANKTRLLVEAGVQLHALRSAEKFAEILRFHGIDPPMKLASTAGKPHPKAGKLNKKTGEVYPSHHPVDQMTYAFAKSDTVMQELAEDGDEMIQALLAARFNARSTINETRAQRLLDMSRRGAACVYINYAGAEQTFRASGGDKMNWQNLQRKGKLRDAVEAPDGSVIVVGDSSNIESRMLDWLAGQEDQVEAYRLYDAGKGPDIYCVMAEKLYGRAITKAQDPDERQMGKVTKLGLGYGMGAPKYVLAVRAQTRRKIKLEWAYDAVNTYRRSHKYVLQFWERCGNALTMIANGMAGLPVDFRGVVTTHKDGLLLPNGLVIRYERLERDDEGQWTYWNGRSRQKIYGGKVCENIIQALARIVVMEQTLMVPKRRKLVLSVHDEAVFCVPEHLASKCVGEVERALRTPLPWCSDLPLNCEVGYHKSYGKAKP
jgi:DNA polymerase family A